jgi:flagellar hook protein FlgE
MSFRTALSGLNAAQADLGVISNNIANNKTTGFKESRAEFGDMFSFGNLGSRNIIGTGVKLNAVAQQFKQGNIETTGNPLDLAVDGQGFFRLNDNGAIVYTRAGTFGVDKEGYVINNTGLRLTGYQVDATTGRITPEWGDIQLNTTDIQPLATSRADFGVNLNAGAVPPKVTPFNYLDPKTYNFSTSVSVYDSQGTSHGLTVYFVKEAASNSWTTYYSVDGTKPDNVTVTASNLKFTNAGQLDPTSLPIDLSIDLNAVLQEKTGDTTATTGADTPLKITVHFDESTQFGSPFGTNSTAQNGYASGRLVGVDVGDDGTMFGRYTNGQAKTLAQIALVNFRNVQGLSPVGDTTWVQTYASGEPVIGPPGTASLGLVRSGSLEEANVELTEQLVNMINAQRNFQANAQVISTADSLTQTLLNIRS